MGSYICPTTEKTSCSQRKIKSPGTLFEARKVAGSATYKQSQTVWNDVVLKRPVMDVTSTNTPRAKKVNMRWFLPLEYKDLIDYLLLMMVAEESLSNC